MTSVYLKATGIWLVIVIAAIFNGTIREFLLVPNLGAEISLPVSGLVLAGFIFLISVLFIPWLGKLERSSYINLGLFWLAITLVFEFTFGYFVAAKSITEIIEVFNIATGNLFVFDLFVTAISPLAAAKIRAII